MINNTKNVRATIASNNIWKCIIEENISNIDINYKQLVVDNIYDLLNSDQIESIIGTQNLRDFKINRDNVEKKIIPHLNPEIKKIISAGAPNLINKIQNDRQNAVQIQQNAPLNPKKGKHRIVLLPNKEAKQIAEERMQVEEEKKDNKVENQFAAPERKTEEKGKTLGEEIENMNTLLDQIEEGIRQREIRQQKNTLADAEKEERKDNKLENQYVTPEIKTEEKGKTLVEVIEKERRQIAEQIEKAEEERRQIAEQIEKAEEERRQIAEQKEQTERRQIAEQREQAEEERKKTQKIPHDKALIKVQELIDDLNKKMQKLQAEKEEKKDNKLENQYITPEIKTEKNTIKTQNTTDKKKYDEALIKVQELIDDLDKKMQKLQAEKEEKKDNKLENQYVTPEIKTEELATFERKVNTVNTLREEIEKEKTKINTLLEKGEEMSDRIKMLLKQIEETKKQIKGNKVGNQHVTPERKTEENKIYAQKNASKKSLQR